MNFCFLGSCSFLNAGTAQNIVGQLRRALRWGSGAKGLDVHGKRKMAKSVIMLIHAGAKKAGTSGRQTPSTVKSQSFCAGTHIMASVTTQAIPHAPRKSRAARVALCIPFPTKMRRYMRTMLILTRTSEAL